MTNVTQPVTPNNVTFVNWEKEIRESDWYEDFYEKHGEYPDLHTQDYDYGKAWLEGARPDDDGHWPSEYKGEFHKNRFVPSDEDPNIIIDSITGEPVSKEPSNIIYHPLESQRDLHHDVSLSDWEAEHYAFGKSLEWQKSLNPEGWGAVLQGIDEGQAFTYQVLAGIPGGINMFNDFMNDITPFDEWFPSLFPDSKDTPFGKVEQILRHKAEINMPHNVGIEPPQTMRGKFFKGFARVPQTVGTYIPATILTGNNPAYAMAMTDALHAMGQKDKNIGDVLTAAGRGYLMGKIIHTSNLMGLSYRLPALFALGFGESKIHGLDNEDAFVEGAVFASLGFLGGWKPRRTTAEALKERLLGKKSEAQKRIDEINKELKAGIDKNGNKLDDAKATVLLHELQALELTRDPKVAEDIKNIRDVIPLIVEKTRRIDELRNLEKDRVPLNAPERPSFTQKIMDVGDYIRELLNFDFIPLGKSRNNDYLGHIITLPNSNIRIRFPKSVVEKEQPITEWFNAEVSKAKQGLKVDKSVEFLLWGLQPVGTKITLSKRFANLKTKPRLEFEEGVITDWKITDNGVVYLIKDTKNNRTIEVDPNVLNQRYKVSSKFDYSVYTKTGQRLNRKSFLGQEKFLEGINNFKQDKRIVKPDEVKNFWEEATIKVPDKANSKPELSGDWTIVRYNRGTGKYENVLPEVVLKKSISKKNKEGKYETVTVHKSMPVEQLREAEAITEGLKDFNFNNIKSAKEQLNELDNIINRKKEEGIIREDNTIENKQKIDEKKIAIAKEYNTLVERINELDAEIEKATVQLNHSAKADKKTKKNLEDSIKDMKIDMGVFEKDLIATKKKLRKYKFWQPKELTKEELARIKKLRKEEQQELDALERGVYNDTQWGQMMADMGQFDTRPVKELLLDLATMDKVTKEIIRKYNDLTVAQSQIFGRLKPANFITYNPIPKWVADLIQSNSIRIDNLVEHLLYGTRYEPLKFGQVSWDKSKPLLRRWKLGFTSLRYLNKIPSRGERFGFVTRYDALADTNWQSAKKVIDTANKIEQDKVALSLKEGRAYTEKNQDGTFRYEVTEAELKNTYKLNEQEIGVYQDLRNGMNEIFNYYNREGKAWSKVEGKKWIDITQIPNYMPHVWMGDVRIYVNKWSDINANGSLKKGVKPEEVWSAENTLHATLLKNELKKTGDYEISSTRKDGAYRLNIVKIDRGNVKQGHGNPKVRDMVEAFSHAANVLRRGDKENLAQHMERIAYEMKSNRGFGVHGLKRSGVKGQLGSRAGIRGLEDFRKAYTSFFEGAIRSIENKKISHELNELTRSPMMQRYPNTVAWIRLYENHMFGLDQTGMTKFIEKISREYLAGEQTVTKTLGAANVYARNIYLMFGQMRFLISQGIQPYQMIPNKLMDLKVKGIDGKIWESMALAQRDLFKPTKESIDVIQHAGHQRVIDAKFLQEFLDADIRRGRISVGGKLLRPQTFMDVLTLKDVSGKVEQFSRLNATLMFYHFLRSAGKSHEHAKQESVHLADKYMVQYSLEMRPLLYTESGLGIAGKPAGLFKTFMHNWYSQFAEHIATTKKYKDPRGLLTMTGTMILTAGLYGVIGIKVADNLLKMLGFEKSLTQLLLESELDDWVLWGVPSATFNVDLTPTIAAPGITPGDLFNVPALSMIGLTPRDLRDRKNGIIWTGFNYAKKLATGKLTPYDSEKFYKSFAPLSFHADIEAYYGEGRIGWGPLGQTQRLLGFVGLMGTDSPYQKGPYRDPKKDGRAIINRDFKDRVARHMSARSLKEAAYLKVMWEMNKLDDRLNRSLDSYAIYAAHLLGLGQEIPSFVWDKAIQWGETPESFMDKVWAKYEKTTETFIDSMWPENLTPKFEKRLKMIDNYQNKFTHPEDNQTIIPDKNIILKDDTKLKLPIMPNNITIKRPTNLPNNITFGN